jgi:hypothetical protein
VKYLLALSTFFLVSCLSQSASVVEDGFLGKLLISGSDSTVSSSASVLDAEQTATFTVTPKNIVGDPYVLTSPATQIAFVLSEGTSAGQFSPAVDAGNGIYTSVFTAKTGGTLTKVTAKISGVSITSSQPIVTVNNVSIFNGWAHVKSVGPKNPAVQATDMTPLPAAVTLQWDAMTLNGSSVQSYNIYRGTVSGSVNLTTPLASGISANSRSYTDSTVTGGSTYFYIVAPVDANGAAVIAPTVGDTEIKVIVPRDNMVLVHRWAANKEMCVLMGKTPLRNSNYRCVVATGANAPPGTGNSGFFDMGVSFFMDAYEQGCNYTNTNTCTDATVNSGSAWRCIGVRATPNTFVSAAVDSVYYSRASGKCFINTDGASAWLETGDAGLSSTQRRSMVKLAPGLPPLLWANQPVSSEICLGQTVAGFAGTKRLPRRKEYFVASAWDASYSDDRIVELEDGGLSLDTDHTCNTASAKPQTGATDISATNPSIAYENSVFPTALDTLPGCRNSDCVSATSTYIRAVRTGSDATKNCVSRYGAQDLIGNAWEWSSDQITCSSGICYGTTAASNSIDATNSDFEGVILNNTTDSPTSPVRFYSGNFVQLPLGFLILGSTYTVDGAIPVVAAKLHNDNFYGITHSSNTYGTNPGGTWTDYSSAGRYTIRLRTTPTTAQVYNGFRCMIPAE